MPVKYPDYQNGIVNLACSVLKYYGAEYRHATLPVLDRWLAKDYKNVVVMLFDGMGTDALEQHLPGESFLRRHYITGISSVFPPTTTAATTSIASGLTPMEHGWIGWSLYFKEIDKIVNIFPNTLKDRKEPAADYHVAEALMPYESIYDKINRTGNAGACSVSAFGTNKIASMEELFAEVKRLCGEEGRKYIYSYWEDPDISMHKYGYCDIRVTEAIRDINAGVERLCGELKDTLVIVTADHGHINLKYKLVSDYPKLFRMLERPVTIESRAAGFYIREEYKERFAEEFHRIFRDDFILLSKREVIGQKLFGDGNMHPRFPEFIGDFLAVAVAGQGIAYNHESRQFVSNHAGLTEQEMTVPFIAVETDG